MTAIDTVDNLVLQDICDSWNLAKDDRNHLLIRLKNYRIAKRLFDLVGERHQAELAHRCGINRTHVDNIGRLLHADARRLRHTLIATGMIIGGVLYMLFG